MGGGEQKTEVVGRAWLRAAIPESRSYARQQDLAALVLIGLHLDRRRGQSLCPLLTRASDVCSPPSVLRERRPHGPCASVVHARLPTSSSLSALGRRHLPEAQNRIRRVNPSCVPPSRSTSQSSPLSTNASCSRLSISVHARPRAHLHAQRIQCAISANTLGHPSACAHGHIGTHWFRRHCLRQTPASQLVPTQPITGNECFPRCVAQHLHRISLRRFDRWSS